jgi:hypothetical protein
LEFNLSSIFGSRLSQKSQDRCDRMYNVHGYIDLCRKIKPEFHKKISLKNLSFLSLWFLCLIYSIRPPPPQIKIITILRTHPSLDIDPYRKLIGMFVLGESIVTVVNVIQKRGVGKQ